MTTLTSTTLAAACATNDKSIIVTSASAFVVGHVVFIDAEAMKVLAIRGTVIDVFRGYDATYATDHLSGAICWVNTPEAYYYDDPKGAGVAATQTYLPHINVRTGSIFVLSDKGFTPIQKDGVPVPVSGGASYGYTAAGALTLASGIHHLNGTTLAMTLAAPGASTPEGAVLTIIADNASAHTVTYTAGFLGGTTSNDVATFGGAIGDSFTVVNIGGVWRPICLRNVTFA